VSSIEIGTRLTNAFFQVAIEKLGGNCRLRVRAGKLDQNFQRRVKPINSFSPRPSVVMLDVSNSASHNVRVALLALKIIDMAFSRLSERFCQRIDCINVNRRFFAFAGFC